MPNAAWTCHSASARLAAISPAPTRAMPPAVSIRGPMRSASTPLPGPIANSTAAETEKASATAPREAPNSPCKGAKNVPKL